MAYRYHAFLSYSNFDREWAKQVHSDLAAAGLRVFIDQRDLEAGKVWPDELVNAIRDSQHLIVLWTNHAKSSAWVNKEMATFDTDAGATERAQQSMDRRMLCVLLEGQPDAYATLQAIPDLRALNAYQAGLAWFNQAMNEAWTRVVHELVRILRRTRPSITIPVAVVAMKDSEVAALTGGETISGRAAQLNAVLATLGLNGVATIAGWYGPRRTDWRPFGGPGEVSTLLNQLLGTMNQLPTGLAFDWEEVDFLSPPFAQAREAVAALERPISLVLVDPLSLYSSSIALNFNLLDRCFRRAGTLVLALPPFALATANATLRRLVEVAGAPLFDVYYQPPVPYQDHATCGVNVADSEDLRRMLRLRIGHYVRTQTPAPANPILEATAR